MTAFLLSERYVTSFKCSFTANVQAVPLKNKAEKRVRKMRLGLRCTGGWMDAQPLPV